MTVRYKNKSPDEAQIPKAVVVGLCAHGLSIVRDLHCVGINVIALENNVKLPGTFTRCANVKFVDDINNQGLIDALVTLAGDYKFRIKPVLFLTNDRMVETIGNNVELIESYYNLSWAGKVSNLLPLLDKRNIEARCQETGLNYPKSVLIYDIDQMLGKVSKLNFPIILKPTRPLSSFKTLVLDSIDSLSHKISIISSSMPVLAQEFIPGDDSSIYFGALVLNNGDIFSRFEGRKLRSRPMGHTTVAVSEENDDVFEIAKHFFDGLNLSGPVSLELKKNVDGSYWVIEPTVGRTDFWVGLCSANGTNFPLAEFQMANELISSISNQEKKSVWVNEERDPGAVLWLLFKYPSFLFKYRLKGVFVSSTELRPAFVFFISYINNVFTRGLGRAKRLFSRK